MKTNNIVVLVGPSGVGKDTLIDLIVDTSDYCRFPTCTTRAARAGEINGVHYNFISHPSFASLFNKGYLLERFEVEGNFYSLCIDDLLAGVADGQKLIMHLSAEGLIRLNEFGVQLTSIWVQSPYHGAIEKRLQARGLSEEEIATRVNHESTEERFKSLFDYLIINHDGQQKQVAEHILNLITR